MSHIASGGLISFLSQVVVIKKLIGLLNLHFPITKPCHNNVIDRSITVHWQTTVRNVQTSLNVLGYLSFENIMYTLQRRCMISFFKSKSLSLIGCTTLIQVVQYNSPILNLSEFNFTLYVYCTHRTRPIFLRLACNFLLLRVLYTQKPVDWSANPQLNWMASHVTAWLNPRLDPATSERAKGQ